MFHSARIKLTAWYLLILMSITVLFSLGLFRLSSLELDRIQGINKQRMQRWMDLGLPIPQERRFRNLLPFEDPELIAETKNRIARQLIGINAIIFILAGGASYLLAGRTLRPIETMVEEQKRFISDASHELKTPLTSLKTSLEVYLRNNNRTKKDAEEVIQESLADIERLHLLTEHLLTQATLDHHHFITHTKVSLEQVVTEAAQAVKTLADHKDIDIKLELYSGTVNGNVQALQQLFAILLENAIKYSEPSKQITLQMKKKGKQVLISVTDQGQGITQEDLPYIFDRFYRGDESRSGLQKGFGLGLSIAKKIVDAHHGKIQALSTLGKGSTFTVSLPST